MPYVVNVDAKIVDDNHLLLTIHMDRMCALHTEPNQSFRSGLYLYILLWIYKPPTLTQLISTWTSFVEQPTTETGKTKPTHPHFPIVTYNDATEITVRHNTQLSLSIFTYIATYYRCLSLEHCIDPVTLDLLDRFARCTKVSAGYVATGP